MAKLKKVLKFVSWSVLGLFALLGLLTLGVATLGLKAFKSRQLEIHRPLAEGDKLLTLTLSGELDDLMGPESFHHLMGHNRLSLHDIVRALDQAAKDDDVKALVLKLAHPTLGMAQAQELRQALSRFKGRGKKIYAFSSTFGVLHGGTKDYYLASIAHEIWMQPMGTLALTGLGFEAPYLREGLDKLGIKVSVFQRKEYKSYPEMFTENAPTEASRQQTWMILKGAEEIMLQEICQERGVKLPELHAIMHDAPYTIHEAKALKLVDHDGYYETMLKHARDAFAPKAKDKDKLKVLALQVYCNRTVWPENPKVKIAILHAAGPIISDKDDDMPWNSHESMGVAAFLQNLQRAVKDEAVKAIVVRVDSGGGDALISENMMDAIERGTKTKPIVVSFGNSAASGGYLMSCKASKILALPLTLTGSIGAFLGKPVLIEFWKKLGVHWTDFYTHTHGGLGNINEDFTPEGAKRMNEMVDSTYAHFVDYVAKGRNLAPAAVETIAKGHVWLGQQALGYKLVDGLGGMHEAIIEAHKLAGISDTMPVSYTYMSYRGLWGGLFADLLDQGDEDGPSANQSFMLSLMKVLSKFMMLFSKIESIFTRLDSTEQGRISLEDFEGQRPTRSH